MHSIRKFVQKVIDNMLQQSMGLIIRNEYVFAPKTYKYTLSVLILNLMTSCRYMSKTDYENVKYPHAAIAFMCFIGILGQVWYLIVSTPDFCTLTYFTLTVITKFASW